MHLLKRPVGGHFRVTIASQLSTFHTHTYNYARGGGRGSNHFKFIHEISKLINETTEFSCVYDLMCFVVICTEMEFKKMCIFRCV